MSTALERAELTRLLLLMTAGLTLLAPLGEIVLMASPWYALVPVMKAILLLLLARKIVALRRWAMITTIVVSALSLVGFTLGSLAGLLPQVDHTVTLTGLFTELALPITLMVLSAQLLAATRLPAAQLPAAQLPAAQLPAAQLPAAQLPAAQLPAAQLPAAQLPAAQLPAAQLPAAQLPAAQLSAAQR